MPSNKIYVFTYSCPAGHYESERIWGLFQEAGWEILKDVEKQQKYPFTEKCVRDADLIIFNTCAFTESMAEDCCQLIAQMQQLKKENSELIICGCLPKTNPERLEPIFKGFSFSWGELNKLIDHLGLPTIEAGIKKHALPAREWNVRISTGCAGHCTFCADKKAIGHIRSRPVESIISEIKDGLKKDCTFISLSAHDSGAYGLDIGLTLPILLEEILKIKNSFTISIDCLNPQHLATYLDKLIEIYRDKRFLKYIHPPIQSGSDRILGKMNRQYSSKVVVDCLTKFQKEIPQMKFGTDIIVGFPSETEDEFKETLRIIATIPFKGINVFSYSVRPNTPAASFPGQIPEIIKQKRKNQAIALWKKTKRLDLR